MDPPTPGQGRCLYRASNGNGYGVIGQKVVSITPGWGIVELGDLVEVRTNQVSMIDNGIDIMVVDGSATGYTIHMADNTFAAISDPTGAFTGSSQVATLDTFVLFNYPGTKNFGSTLSNTITFDALYIASKASYPDPLQALIVNRRELILLGALKSEIWYDVGATQFPFAILPGAYIEHGIGAPFSVASADIETLWLAQDLQGAWTVVKLKGYDVSKASSFALDYAMQQMVLAGADLTQAIGWTWQQNGHSFYTLTFPSGDQTWVFDLSLEDDPTMAWHQEAFNGPDGVAHRLRDGCSAFMYNTNVTLDHTTGTLYAVDQSRYTDEVEGVLWPIVCVRSFGHIVSAWNQQVGQPADVDGKILQLDNFRLDMDCGMSAEQGQVVGLRWSWDHGHTFGNTIMIDAGSPGKYITQPLWTQLGALGRDPILEVVHQINGQAALQGAWVNATILNK